MLKILAISDIEDNQAAVELLLNDINPRDYDCALIAGDIGSKIISWMMEEIGALLPVFYVYGNNEYELEYDKNYAPNTHHLHKSIQELNGYYFSGFSGCPANWGKNQIYVDQIEALNSLHEDTIKQLSDLKAQHYAERTDFQPLLYDYNVADIKMSISARTQLEKEKRKQWKKYKGLLYTHETALTGLKQTTQYQAYSADRKQTYKHILHLNKQSLFEMLVCQHQIDMRKTILVTHEKFTCLNDYFPIPALLNVFGHSGPHSHKFWRKTHFVNVTALDNNPTFYNLITGTPKAKERGKYAVITIGQQEVSVEFRLLSQTLPFD